MKNKTLEELEKEVSQLTEDNRKLQEELNQIQRQDQTIYKQINQLLLWKSSLKVRINDACPNKDLVGKEGYICDLFLDGWTIVVYGNPNNPNDFSANEFYRIEANNLDVIEWDIKKFEATMKNLDYVQVDGIWTHKDYVKTK